MEIMNSTSPITDGTSTESPNNQDVAVIIGAGPAGLTAASELLERTTTRPIVLEKSNEIGGISRTIRYKGNRIDIGGHRFFSKSDRVMDWWLDRIPLQDTSSLLADEKQAAITYQNRSRDIATNEEAPDPEQEDRVMLLRRRKTRIYYRRRFFVYPITLSGDTLSKLGLGRTIRIGCSYIWSTLFPIKPERTLEQFFINRFGRALYRTFFKSYTEKVWGISCSRISAEWGAQRIKGLSIGKAVGHFIKKMVQPDSDIRQKSTETSLIERFLYPKFGPGQVWETVAEEVQKTGGEVHCEWNVSRIVVDGTKVLSIEAENSQTGEKRDWTGKYFFSTMPIQELIRAMQTPDGQSPVPENIRAISEGLIYRDFITVGLLLDKLKVQNEEADSATHKLIRDTWLYIQESDVKVGRMQIFNNWSPYLLEDPSKVWLGLEYFCFEGDALWNLSDEAMIKLAIEETHRIGLINREDVRDATVIRVEKTYPAYFGSYERFPELREWIDSIENLFLIGRNGMHKYNNQDHSMLTAMTAVDNIIEGRTDKSNIWAVNTEQDYHEEDSSKKT
jgi:protoporphyrinogen oxidase